MADSIDASELLLLAQDFQESGESAFWKEVEIEAAFAEKAKGMIVARAPRDIGDYASSWRTDVNQAGTDSPQGFRLELGFHGTDADGRVVSQSPQPHVAPVAEELGEPFEQELGERVVG